MLKLGLTSIFGIVGYLLGYGLFIPKDLAVFHILAAAGMMAGYGCGDVSATHVARPLAKVFVLVLALSACVGSAIFYIIRIQAGSADKIDIAILALLITVLFFSLSFLMPMVGVRPGGQRAGGG
jgi:hypothetical protein